jgi:hypothetical protein
MILTHILLGLSISANLASRTEAEETPKALLPSEAIWVMRYDDKVDGEVH